MEMITSFLDDPVAKLLLTGEAANPSEAERHSTWFNLSPDQKQGLLERLARTRLFQTSVAKE